MIKKEKVTVQDYRNLAQQHIDELKYSLKTFISTGVIMISGLAVIAALTFSWFVNNNDVSAEGMKISAYRQSVELRSKGTKGVHDDILTTFWGSDGEKGFWYSLLDNPLDTTADSPVINWLLSEKSELGNYNEGTEVDFSDDQNKRIDYAIEPGKSGNLVFYVVPKVSGNIELNCHLDIIPFNYEDGRLNSPEEDDYVFDFLKGHILFNLVNETDNTLLWLDENRFTLSIENAKIDEEYKYVLHWAWPQVFGEVVLIDGDSYLNQRAPLYSEYSNDEAVRTALVASILEKPELYFYSSLTKEPLPKTFREKNCIEVVHHNTTDDLLRRGNTEAIQYFVDLSSYYNQADQYIGKSINCIQVSLSAELTSVED